MRSKLTPLTTSAASDDAVHGIERQAITPSVAAAYIVCILVWGTTWYAVRLCVLPGAFETFTALSLRFIIAMSCLGLVFLSGIGKFSRPTKQALIWTAVCGTLSVCSFMLVYNAERWISGGLAAIISTTTPLLTALLVTLTGVEKVSSKTIVGILLSFVGIILIFQERLSVSIDQANGVVMLFFSVLLTSLSGVILKKYTGNQSPLTSTLILTTVAAICFTTLGVVLEGPVLFTQSLPTVPFLAATYLGIMSSVVAFVCWFYLLKRVSLMALTSLVFFPPIIALGVDALFERQVVLSGMTYLGICITLLGVASRLLKRKAD